MTLQQSTRRRYRQDARPLGGKVRIPLRELRLSRGLTHEQAARLAGYAGKSGWAMVELGHNIPSAEQMRRMAAALHGDPAELFPELAVYEELAPLIGYDGGYREAVLTLLSICNTNGIMAEARKALSRLRVPAPQPANG